MKREKECTVREGEGRVCNDGGRVFVVSEANGNSFRVWLRMCGVCHVLSCTYAHVCMYVCVCVCVCCTTYSGGESALQVLLRFLRKVLREARGCGDLVRSHYAYTFSIPSLGMHASHQGERELERKKERDTNATAVCRPEYLNTWMQ